MIRIRKAEDRGVAKYSWLHARHTFSFGSYHDRDHMGFSELRVINEDEVEPGTGFSTHGHKDMEIITYVISGALAHKDSLGNASVIRPGEIQRMSAGTGVEHSEFNHSSSEKTHLLQIWILPNRKGHAPSYEQIDFSTRIKDGELLLLARENGGDGAVHLNQDVKIFLARAMQSDKKFSYNLLQDRCVWLQVVKGEGVVEGEKVKAGDGISWINEQSAEIKLNQSGEFLLFDLPL